MKNLILVLVSAVFSVACGVQSKPVGMVGNLPSATPEVRQAKKEVIKDSYLVEVKADLPASFLNQVGAKVKGHYKNLINVYHVTMTAEQAEKIAKHPNVISVEADVVMTPNQSQQGATWGIDRVDQRNMPLDTIYNYDYDGTGVTAYIIDSGVNYEHEDFGGRASLVYDIINDGSKDCSGHGTHIAGTIGSATYGVAKNATIKGVKVACGSVGVGNYIAGLDWVGANATGLSVANMSANTTTNVKSLDNAINALVRKNVVVVVSSGNNGMNACNTSPASASSAIVVAASGSTDVWWNGSNNSSCVDLIAPGIAITSLSHADNTGTRVMGGTSMASPHVVGVAVLYRQANPSVGAKDVLTALVANATPNVVTGVPAGTPNKLIYSR